MKWFTRYGAVALLLFSAVVSACGEREDDEAGEAEETEVAAQAATPPGQPVQITEDKEGLFAKATVQPEEARATAMKEMPNGEITKGELEEEDGNLIYSFDIKVPGQEGITELHIDAKSGKVIKKEHEKE